MSVNYIDLFAGAGGLSEGFVRAGFNPIAHVEMDESACFTLKTRVAYHYLKYRNRLNLYYSYLKREISRESLYRLVPQELMNSVINAKIDEASIEQIFTYIDLIRDGRPIDLIVGGPPCQAYSTVGRSKITSLKKDILADQRYELYKQYGKFLKRYNPEYFVFENVEGILSAEEGTLIDQIREYFWTECGYKIKLRTLTASNFGVLQARKRVIIIGKKGDEDFKYPYPEPFYRKENWGVKKCLLSDLEPLNPGEAKHISAYLSAEINDYLLSTGIRTELDIVTQHITRPHNPQDLAIYRQAIEDWIDRKQRLKYNRLASELQSHGNKTAFLDRFKVVNPDGLSHTIVAHISRDGHYYIYPDKEQIRSISVREAARIQSFPDSYFFEGSRSAAFKQIGNAVPPMLAYQIAQGMKKLYTPVEFADESTSTSIRI